LSYIYDIGKTLQQVYIMLILCVGQISDQHSSLC